MRNHVTKVKVAIIGAGASGLQCATHLLDDDNSSSDDASVLILEGRNRIGGRIFTSTETRTKISQDSRSCAEDEPVIFSRDHGASWVHGIGCEEDNNWNPIVKLLQMIPSPGNKSAVVNTHLQQVTIGNPWTRPDTVLHKTGGIAIYCDGTLASLDSVSEAIQRHYELLDQISDYADRMFEAREGMETVYTSVADVRSKLLKSNGSSDGGREPPVSASNAEKLFPFFQFLLENWHGQASKDLQVGYLATDPSKDSRTDENYVPDGDFIGSHCKVRTGMITVLQPLLSKVDHHNNIIRLNELVLKVKDMKDHGVRIETQSGLIVDAECCVSTLPLGCLKRNADTLFEPALSEEKVEAIRSISAGSYKKVFMTFTKIFWLSKAPFLGLVREKKGGELGNYLLINNLWAKDKIPCLEAILCGDLGEWANHQSDDSIKNSVIGFIEDAMGFSNLQEMCTDVHVTRWEEDPFALGTYSSFRLGTLERHIDSFSVPEWDGRLVFAGEHTESEHQGSVHGALMSGSRAAEAVREFLSKDTRPSNIEQPILKDC